MYTYKQKTLFMAENQEKGVQENLYTSLRELGLFESEIRLYLASLSLGPATIATIAEHLGIPRPNVYKAILGLEGHGLANFSSRKRYSRTFVVEPPTVVLELLRKKRDTMSDLDRTLVGVMPDLLAKYHQGASLTKIRVLQGKDQFLKAFFSILDEEKSETQFFGSAKDFVEFISWDEENEWIKQRMKKNIFIKSLLLPSGEAEMLHRGDKQFMREIRIIKGLAPFVTAFQLFANKALIWQPEGRLAILIEDEYVVAMLRSMFNWMWNASRPKVETTQKSA